MANNRLYLKCKVCGGRVFLGKSFAGGYSQTVYTPEQHQKMLEDFYDKHTFCNGNESDGLYEIEYEHPPEPTVKVVEVVHARWEYDDPVSPNKHCTNCWQSADVDDDYNYTIETPYCKNCGATMDGKEGDT